MPYDKEKRRKTMKKRAESSERWKPRFLRGFKKTRGCWKWKGTILSNGYGQFTIRFKRFKAHNFSYQLYIGKIPKGLVLDHLCRNRACVNPKHLEPVTHRENILRGNGIAAKNHKKTHCLHGHSFADQKPITRINKYGNVERECRVCKNLYFKRYNAIRQESK